MLPALVLFRPLWTEPARARCISSLRYPNAFWPECYRVPCFFYAFLGREIQLQIHLTNLWNPVASYRPCVLSPSLRIAPVPSLGTGGIGMFRRLRHGTGRRVLPCKKANPAFQSQLINPACKVGPLKSGLALLLRMEMARMFARHLRAAVSLPPLSWTRTLYSYIPGPMAGKR